MNGGSIGVYKSDTRKIMQQFVCELFCCDITVNESNSIMKYPAAK